MSVLFFERKSVLFLSSFFNIKVLFFSFINLGTLIILVEIEILMLLMGNQYNQHRNSIKSRGQRVKKKMKMRRLNRGVFVNDGEATNFDEIRQILPH